MGGAIIALLRCGAYSALFVLGACAGPQPGDHLKPPPAWKLRLLDPSPNRDIFNGHFGDTPTWNSSSGYFPNGEPVRKR